MQKSHLTAYKLSVASIFINVIATHKCSNSVGYSNLIVYLFKMFVRKISGVQISFLCFKVFFVLHCLIIIQQSIRSFLAYT